MKIYIISSMISVLIFSCTKQNEKDFKSGLFTAQVNNFTFSSQKLYNGNSSLPSGYFNHKVITSSNTSVSLIGISAIFDESNKCNLQFTSNFYFNPNEVKLDQINQSQSYVVLNGIKQYATRVIVNHGRGNVSSGTYEMYNNGILLCKGQFSAE